MIRLTQIYSDGPRNPLAIGPDRDFYAAMDCQLNLAVTGPITRFKLQLRLSITLRRNFYSARRDAGYSTREEKHYHTLF